jgi:hypothetical protein
MEKFKYCKYVRKNDTQAEIAQQNLAQLQVFSTNSHRLLKVSRFFQQKSFRLVKPAHI